MCTHPSIFARRSLFCQWQYAFRTPFCVRPIGLARCGSLRCSERFFGRNPERGVYALASCVVVGDGAGWLTLAARCTWGALYEYQIIRGEGGNGRSAGAFHDAFSSLRSTDGEELLFYNGGLQPVEPGLGLLLGEVIPEIYCLGSRSLRVCMLYVCVLACSGLEFWVPC